MFLFQTSKRLSWISCTNITTKAPATRRKYVEISNCENVVVLCLDTILPVLPPTLCRKDFLLEIKKYFCLKDVDIPELVVDGYKNIWLWNCNIKRIVVCGECVESVVLNENTTCDTLCITRKKVEKLEIGKN